MIPSAFVDPQPPGSLLNRILQSVETELASAMAATPEEDLSRALRDAPPVRSLAEALRAKRFSLIAEIKHRSPSQGQMRPGNVAVAADAYEASDTVAALSVLTNQTWFGTGLEDLRKVRRQTTKPILRKEFIVHPYQVLEGRAAGADAILLMANVLTASGLSELFSAATATGLEVLFEVHTAEEIARLPPGARLCGINSRTFAADATARYAAAQTARAEGSVRDLSTDLERFALASQLPPNVAKVAESGITPSSILRVRDEWHFQAALVGTSLLLSPEGLPSKLAEFERALRPEPCCGA